VTTSTTSTPTPLSPVRLGSLSLRNRLVVAPMTRVSASTDGTPTAEMASYYADFARGGFGLVITEGVHPDLAESHGYENQPGLAGDSHVRGWSAVTAAVHDEGAHIVAQLMHAGALSQGNPHSTRTVGPSAVAPLGRMMPEYGGHGPWPTPDELGSDEIDAIVCGFAAAARRAAAAGFDGVEVHGANGYLLDQFLTTYTNQRRDAYGGSAANRVRLTAEVVAAVRDAVPGLVVGVRLSQTKVNDFHYRWPGGVDEARTIFTAVADAGATYIHVASEGRSWLSTARLEGGDTNTRIARHVTGLPVIANGGMHDIDQTREVLADEHADLVSIGHGALANPDLPQRIADGRPLELFDRSMLTPDVTLSNARRWREDRAR
jgi:2,4-dienoyl-CoA reductase-like NADH-dependent reductase (Old Yellow Enzyme family)